MRLAEGNLKQLIPSKRFSLQTYIRNFPLMLCRPLLLLGAGRQGMRTTSFLPSLRFHADADDFNCASLLRTGCFGPQVWSRSLLLFAEALLAEICRCTLELSPAWSHLLIRWLWLIILYVSKRAKWKPKRRKALCGSWLMKISVGPLQYLKVANPENPMSSPQCCHCGWRGKHAPNCPFGVKGRKSHKVVFLRPGVIADPSNFQSQRYGTSVMASCHSCLHQPLQRLPFRCVDYWWVPGTPFWTVMDLLHLLHPSLFCRVDYWEIPV